jgi:hypothetical protein
MMMIHKYGHFKAMIGGHWGKRDLGIPSLFLAFYKKFLHFHTSSKYMLRKAKRGKKRKKFIYNLEVNIKF